ncbi:hypothetical protein V2G26_001829 [Clonostachys chloroleuca]
MGVVPFLASFPKRAQADTEAPGINFLARLVLRLAKVCECDGSPDGGRVTITLFRGCRDHLPLAGMFSRVLLAGHRFAHLCATHDGSATSQEGKLACRQG